MGWEKPTLALAVFGSQSAKIGTDWADRERPCVVAGVASSGWSYGPGRQTDGRFDGARTGRILRMAHGFGNSRVTAKAEKVLWTSISLTRPTIGLRGFHAASCAGMDWLRCSSVNRKCCCSTSPQADSIPPNGAVPRRPRMHPR